MAVRLKQHAEHGNSTQKGPSHQKVSWLVGSYQALTIALSHRAGLLKLSHDKANQNVVVA